LVKPSPALNAVLLGQATLGASETPEVVAERYELNLQKKRLERRLEEIDSILKLRTGERQVGAFLVNVSSYNVERVDSDAVKEILGEATPIKTSVSVRLTVVPA